MNSRKLIYCCIAGILLGFLVPMIFRTNQYTTLMVGMAAGLGIGYLLDMRDEKVGKENSRRIANKKAAEANRLMERARKGLEDENLRGERDLAEYDADDVDDVPGSIEKSEPDFEEEAKKLSDAEELLRSARERMK